MTRRLLLLTATALLLAAPAASASVPVDVDGEDGSSRCVWVTFTNGERLGYCVR